MTTDFRPGYWGLVATYGFDPGAPEDFADYR